MHKGECYLSKVYGIQLRRGKEDLSVTGSCGLEEGLKFATLSIQANSQREGLQIVEIIVLGLSKDIVLMLDSNMNKKKYLSFFSIFYLTNKR